ncbi:hypothetical protein IOD16_16890 [Saccharothrix sp. 6-C]|uniref:hypothetical protein n=1 Tax=Saccharothrix sp. 6-C TaxID=2781735 RepID=UPI00191774D5|nr:hypothetical protein [Saccharothrix sp. 6-C]QQQ79913.1 hypothetical protein IOD16_16890 [Saccharothrix sp. 6-C]
MSRCRGNPDVDGAVGAAEIPDREVAETAFGAMDVDDDGRLDWNGLSAHARGLFTATDESAQGVRMVSGD